MSEVGTSFTVRAETAEAVSRVIVEPALETLPQYEVACRAVYEAVYGEEAYATAPQPTRREFNRAKRGNGTEMPFLHRVDHRVGHALEMVKVLLHEEFGLEIDISDWQQPE